ncbi:MAG TPA: PfkB family carbohydrate kinase [Candidatus Nanopelagicales bacterium]|nr:PfkB family carbohydrate kinase [Candidatus Nanopelagicales bacterium]
MTSPASRSTPEVITVGRVSVDLYAQEVDAAFTDSQTFRKSVGGSPTNVAVAVARYGHHAAVVTKVGTDALGDYVISRLASWGVDTRYIGRDDSALTPVVLAALAPPEDPQIIFYRGEAAPDTTVIAADVPDADIRGCTVLWMSVGALAQGSTAQASFEWLATRGRTDGNETVLDLDYRPSMWPDLETARDAAQRAIEHSSVVVGNRTECHMALGIDEPDHIVDQLLERGVRIAIVKLGGGGVLLADASERVRIDPLDIDVLCGLGAGDAFGGALVHGLLSGWNITEIGRFANGAGAYVATQLTCADAMPTSDIVEGIVAQGGTQ